MIRPDAPAVARIVHTPCALREATPILPSHADAIGINLVVRANNYSPLRMLRMRHGRLHLAHRPWVPGQLRVASDEGDALAEGLGQ